MVRASSESAALSKLKLISLSGPPAATWPCLRASRLDVSGALSLAGAGAGFDTAADACFGAFGFSYVQVGGGGLAGLPQANKKVRANSRRPFRKMSPCSVISATFHVPSRTDLMGLIVKHPTESVNYFAH